MHCHLVIPGFLPPSIQQEEFLDGLAVPALDRMLSRGDALSAPSEGFEAWMCKRFGIDRQGNWPLAPVTLAADGGNAGASYWLRADPVHLRVNRDQLILADSSVFDISESEATGFADALNKHFGADGFVFQPLHPARWYVEFSSPPDLRCASLREATGRNIDKMLPTGEDARRFRSVFNEAQMLLFAHPLNEVREAAGKLPINSVWFWGGGTMPAIKPSENAGLWSSDPFVRGLSVLASATIGDSPANANAWLRSKPAGECIVTLVDLESPGQYGDAFGWRQAMNALEQNWFAPLLNALKDGRMKSIAITGFGEEQSIEFKIARSDLWKFWRRPCKLADLLR